MRFNTEEELFEFIESRKRDTLNIRALLCMSMAIYSAYFQGTHWIRQAMGPDRSGQYGRLLASFNPNDRNMLINDNEITRLTIKAIAATYPSEINVDVQPSPRDMGVVNMSQMQLQEDLLTYSLQACGFPEAARQANHQRGICGTWGVGFRIDVSDTPIQLNGQMVPAKTRHVRAFDFDPTRLMLDPACNKRDLREHDDVVFQDTVTKTGIKRMFGIDVKDEDLRPIGTLTINEQNAYAITEGKLFDRYVRDSRTPGAKFYQVHVRGLDGTFRECYIVLELANRKIWINRDNPVTPFGGCGMPFGLIYGHRRGETMWGISDTAMLKEGQDKRNTLLTLLFRHIAKHAGYQWIVDKRWFGTGRVVDDEKIKNSLNNMVAGIVIGGGSNDRNVQAPVLSQTPPPQGFISETLMQIGQSMRENTFRSEGNFGGLKCIDGKSLVSMADGTRKRMRDIRPGDIVVSLDQNSKLAYSPVKWHAVSGDKECFEVKTERGFRINATSDHRVLTYHGWKTIGELAVGDWLVAPKRAKTSESGCTQADLDEAVLLAAWIAEGDKTRMDSYAITNGNDEIRGGIVAAAERMGWVVRIDKGLRIRLLKNKTAYGPNDMLKKHGARTMTTDTVRIPDSIMRADDRVMRTFLSYLFACDGGAFGKIVGYCSNSRDLIDDIRFVLLRYGVRCNSSTHAKATTLSIGEQNSIVTFANTIGIVGKEWALSCVVARASRAVRGSNNFVLPSETRSLMKRGQKWYKNHMGLGIARSSKDGLSESTAAILAEREQNAEFREILDRDVEYVRIKAITSVGVRETYDMEVDGTHCFVADNLVVHNSHVPDASYQSALEEAGQVLGIRVNEDIKGTYEPLMAVLLGTQLGHIQSGSPGTLAQLQQDGFDAEDFGELASMDPLYPPCRITVNEASVRYRSPDAKRQQLIQAVQLQAVSPEDFRMSMAGLDSPTSDTDQYMSTEIGKAVSKLLVTGEFEAEPLGQYGKWMIAALQKALFDKRCKANPQLRQMVREAIVQQQQVSMQEMMMNDPRMMAQQQAQPAQAAAPPMSPIDEAIQQFQSQSGVQNVSGQPTAA